MKKHDGFQRQISKYLDQVPTCTVNTNEILLRLIATELAVIADGIGTLAHIDYDVKVEDEDDTGDTGKSKNQP